MLAKDKQLDFHCSVEVTKKLEQLVERLDDQLLEMIDRPATVTALADKLLSDYLDYLLSASDQSRYDDLKMKALGDTPLTLKDLYIELEEIKRASRASERQGQWLMHALYVLGHKQIEDDDWQKVHSYQAPDSEERKFYGYLAKQMSEDTKKK